MRNLEKKPIDALKLKSELQEKLMEKCMVNGEFSLEKFRENHKKTIRKGKSLLYETVEEYEKATKEVDRMSRI